MAIHNQRGQQAEELAQAYLLQRGYQIRATNWRYKRAEVDIIAQLNNQTVAFVEVRSRKHLQYGHPEETLSPRKKALLAMAAEAWITQTGFIGQIQFDIISITILPHLPPHAWPLKHLPDAFWFYDEATE